MRSKQLFLPSTYLNQFSFRSNSEGSFSRCAEVWASPSTGTVKERPSCYETRTSRCTTPRPMAKDATRSSTRRCTRPPIVWSEAGREELLARSHAQGPTARRKEPWGEVMESELLSGRLPTSTLAPVHRGRRWSCRATRGRVRAASGLAGPPEQSWRRRTGIEPAHRGSPGAPVLKTGRDTSPLSPPGDPGPVPAWGRELYRERRRRGPQPPLRPSWPSIASRARLRSRPEE